MNSKVSVARLSVISNTILIVLKVIVGFISGSVSIISEAIHSTMDLMASVIAFFSVSVSDTPPNEDYPYGYGKYENLSAVIEALLIFVAAIWIIIEAVKKMIYAEPIENVTLGFAVMFFSAIVNFFVSRKLYRVAKETDSIALEADALHLKTDVLTSLGVAIGLLLIWITDLQFLDPVIAIMVALLILKESFELLKNAFYPLLDNSLPYEETEVIKLAITKYSSSFHDLKTRKAGSQRFVEFHLEMPGDISLQHAHQRCDEIEAQIKQELKKDIQISIHVEPSSS